jgi:Domain of unknown function (DUF4169)
MPADILSLSKARKAKARTANSQQAEQNRLLFGRTKAEKIRDQAEKDRLTRVVDGAKREAGKDSQP